MLDTCLAGFEPNLLMRLWWQGWRYVKKAYQFWHTRKIDMETHAYLWLKLIEQFVMMKFKFMCVFLHLVSTWACHTSLCVTIWRGTSTESLFYDVRTFGSELAADPCKKMSTSMYRAFVNKRISCQSKYCVDGRFACVKSDQTSCFHVEHLIDKNGPEFHGMNKDIAANYVMSWGAWNMAMGTMTRLKYHQMMLEKELIYGRNRLQTAREWIQKCHSQQNLFCPSSWSEVAIAKSLASAHSIAYTKLPDYFTAFDIYDRYHEQFLTRTNVQERLKGTSIQHVPKLDISITSAILRVVLF